MLKWIFCLYHSKVVKYRLSAHFMGCFFFGPLLLLHGFGASPSLSPTLCCIQVPLETEPSVSNTQMAICASTPGFITPRLRWLFNLLSLLAGKLAVNVIKRLLSVRPQAFIFITGVASKRKKNTNLEDGCWSEALWRVVCPSGV